jgi:hypothetical protein
MVYARTDGFFVIRASDAESDVRTRNQSGRMSDIVVTIAHHSWSIACHVCAITYHVCLIVRSIATHEFSARLTRFALHPFHDDARIRCMKAPSPARRTVSHDGSPLGPRSRLGVSLRCAVAFGRVWELRRPGGRRKRRGQGRGTEETFDRAPQPGNARLYGPRGRQQRRSVGDAPKHLIERFHVGDLLSW